MCWRHAVKKSNYNIINPQCHIHKVSAVFRQNVRAKEWWSMPAWDRFTFSAISWWNQGENTCSVSISFTAYINQHWECEVVRTHYTLALGYFSAACLGTSRILFLPDADLQSQMTALLIFCSVTSSPRSRLKTGFRIRQAWNVRSQTGVWVATTV